MTEQEEKIRKALEFGNLVERERIAMWLVSKGYTWLAESIRDGHHNTINEEDVNVKVEV